MAIQMTGATNRHLYTISSNFLNSTDPYSISVWINAVWNGGIRLSFIGMYNGNITSGVTTGLQIGVSSTVVGAIECWTYGGTAMVTSPANAMTPYNNVWCMVTYTFDGTNHRIYRNDTLLATGTTVQTPGIFTQIYINGYPPTGTTSETATYQIDTYSYYNRTLSQSEIQTMYESYGSRHAITYGELAGYDFDEEAQGATVTNVIDISGNGNSILNTGAGTAITYTYTGTIASSNLRPVQ